MRHPGKVRLREAGSDRCRPLGHLLKRREQAEQVIANITHSCHWLGFH
jgi:hypothetical protein